MTPKQQALEELMSLLIKHDMEIHNVHAPCDIWLGTDQSIMIKGITPDNIQTELNRMKEDE